MELHFIGTVPCLNIEGFINSHRLAKNHVIIQISNSFQLFIQAAIRKMNHSAQFDFYEKLYFHHLEAREQMTTRLQIPLALIVSVIGMLGFMAQNLDREQFGGWLFGFGIAFGLSTFFIFLSGGYCIGSAWGHVYKVTSHATEWRDYHDSCLSTYGAYSQRQRAELSDAALKKAVFDKYIECASVNAGINEIRSYRYHLTILFFCIAVAFGFVAFCCFFFGNLDKASHTKPTEIVIISPTMFKGPSVSARPPPPPPPPPTREIREGSKPTPPVPPKKEK